MSNIAVDGQVPYGSFDITILETSNVYVADNFSWDQDSTKIQRYDKDGEPLGQRVVKGFATGQCDIQLPDATTAAPLIGHTFVIGSVGYQVERVGRIYESQGDFKARLSLMKFYNPLVTAPIADQSDAEDTPISTLSCTSNETVTWTATGLPAGLSIASDGDITGTPTDQETANVIVIATHADGRVGTREFVWTITA